LSADLPNKECMACLFLGDGEQSQRSISGFGFGVEFSAILSEKHLWTLFETLPYLLDYQKGH